MVVVGGWVVVWQRKVCLTNGRDRVRVPNGPFAFFAFLVSGIPSIYQTRADTHTHKADATLYPSQLIMIFDFEFLKRLF